MKFPRIKRITAPDSRSVLAIGGFACLTGGVFAMFGYGAALIAAGLLMLYALTFRAGGAP